MAQPPVAWTAPVGLIPPGPSSVLPTVEREYHEFYRAPAFRWWKPLLALAMFSATWVVAMVVVFIPAVLYELVRGRLVGEELLGGEISATPLLFLANNLAIAVAIPLAWAAHRAVFRQPVRWLSSVAGRFRWPAFWRFFAVVTPLYLVSLGLELALGGESTELSIRPETWFLLVTVLISTPLQCAGEEFGIRGLGTRAIGSWFGSRRAGLVASAVVTAVAFMLLHGAGDPWLNGFYVAFALCASYLVWKTGGLEAPIALHMTNNLTAELLLPFTGVEGIFERDAGVGSPLLLVQVAVTTAATALILWQARRLGLLRSAAPAALGVAANDTRFPA